MTNQVRCYITGNSNTFYLFLFPSPTNIRLVGSYFNAHELSHLKSLYFVLLVMFLIYFFRRLFDFFFLPSGSLKCHTIRLYPETYGGLSVGGGGGGLYYQEASMKIVKDLFYVHY